MLTIFVQILIPEKIIFLTEIISQPDTIYPRNNSYCNDDKCIG